MNKRILLAALFCAILCAGTFGVLTQMPTMTQSASVPNDSTGKLDSKMLPDIEYNVSFYGAAYAIYDLECLDGSLWGTWWRDHVIYELNPNTGHIISQIYVAFAPAGLASDGTFFYISVDSLNRADPYDNGTIFKYTLDGTLVDSLTINVSTTSNPEYINGLACNGRYLYAISRGLLHRINLDSWSLDNSIKASTGTGLAYYNGLLWTIFTTYLRGFDPDTGLIQERAPFSLPPAYLTGLAGLAYNGTHFIMSNDFYQRLFFLDVPSAVGEAWIRYQAPGTHPMDIAWNGTHYFLTDTDLNKVYILSNVFLTLAQFTVPFDPLGIVVVGNYLYISQQNSPNNLYKYTTQGSLIANYSVGHLYLALEYAGGKLWGTDIGKFIRQIDLFDGHIIASYNMSVNYAGLVFDSRNNVFWAVDGLGSKIRQLDPSNFTKTGLAFDTPTFSGEYGLEFDGKSLIMTSWNTAAIYKIKIAFPSGGSGSIPGFTDIFLLLSLITLISIWFLLRQARPHQRQI